MDVNHLIQPLLQIWQAMAMQNVWLQDAFLLLACVITVVMLFLAGTVMGLLLQALWEIFSRSRQQTETDTSQPS